MRSRLLAAKPAIRQRLMESLSDEQGVFADGDFETFCHPGQRPPDTNWRTWLLMAGRGFGKTRAGAEWVLALVRGEEARPGDPSTSSGRTESLRIAFVAATIDEARAIMVEGPSGLLALADPREIAEWSPSRHRLRFTNGAEAILYSGAHGDSLRGPEHSHAWCDELAKWPQAESAWDNLQLGLRMGDFPRALVTTTPRASALLQRIRDAPDTVETSGSTQANPHLPRAFVRAVEQQYAGTRLGRQELDGVLLTDVAGSLWPADLIARCRRSAPQDFARVVIGVDPPASANGTCGIVVCGVDVGGIAYVISDCSISGASPEGWARAVADASARFGADRVVAESNQGGAMVRSVLLAASATLPVELAHAGQGKSARAEPVAALFENGRAYFAGHFGDLEEQLAGLVAGGGYGGPSTGSGGRSPDRADACVWALWALMLKPRQALPRISVF